MHLLCKCFDRAEGSGTGCVVHGAASLAVFLVVKVKSRRIRRSKSVKGSIMRKAEALFEKPNVLSSELDGSGAGT
jgi:cytidylate kinase